MRVGGAPLVIVDTCKSQTRRSALTMYRAKPGSRQMGRPARASIQLVEHNWEQSRSCAAENSVFRPSVAAHRVSGPPRSVPRRCRLGSRVAFPCVCVH